VSAGRDLRWSAQPTGGDEPFDVLRRCTDDAIYLTQPSRGMDLLAVGAAAVIETSGASRFNDAARAAAALFARVESDAPVPPTLLGGFAFHDDHRGAGVWSGFPAVRLVLPRTLVVRRKASAWRIDTAGAPATPTPGMAPTDIASSPPRTDAWDERVRRVLADIAAGRLAKLVLSRSRAVEAPALDPVDLVRRLRDARPTCTTFLVRRGDVTFIGSTPETLLSLRDGVAETMALAGSMRIGPGEHAESAAARLLACAKNGAEHRFVAEAVRSGLARVSRSVDTTDARRVVTLPEILHLATTYRARLRDDTSILEAVAALHPTPAVGGVPTDVARARLAVEEPDRGWYAGGVGWLDATGDGDVAVALRCALVRDARVRVFAGAGIVAGSDPAAEWDETDAKMTAMLRLVTEHARAA
jgi:isochorismate synthase